MTGNRGPGRRTLHKILRAAGEVLDEHGYDGMSTTAVAQRAGISTATLYRHYPDKHAVLRALFVQLHDEREAHFLPIYVRLAREADWRGPVAELMRTSWRLRMARPGGRSTRRSTQVSPELWTWDQEQTARLAKRLADVLRERKPDLRPVLARRVALASVTLSTALLDLACTEPGAGKAMLEEAIRARIAHLSLYLD